MDNLSPRDLDLLRAIAADPVSFRPADEMSRRRVVSLRQGGYIRSRWDKPGYVLMPKGADVLSAIDDRAKQQAEDNARAAEKEQSDRLQLASDRKKDYRHDFVVAAFSVALTLCVEHADDLFHFCEQAARWLLSLVH